MTCFSHTPAKPRLILKSSGFINGHVTCMSHSPGMNCYKRWFAFVFTTNQCSSNSKSFQALKENGSNGFLVGDKLTLADFAFLDVLTWVWEFDEELVNKFPACKVSPIKIWCLDDNFCYCFLYHMTIYKYYMVRGETGQSVFLRYWLRAYHPEAEG